jgi:hypothetical protein
MAATSSAMAVASSVATIAFRGGGILKVAPPPPPPPLAKVGSAWYSLPQTIRYFASGNLGNVCFYYCEKLVADYLRSDSAAGLPDFMHTNRDSVSFFMGYVLHIVGQHFLHAMLVYGPSSINTPSKYRKTLFGMYCTLMSAAVGSTMLNGVFLHCGMDKTVAFVSTLLAFSVVNYVVIGWVVERSNEAEAAAASSKTSKRTPSKNVKKDTKPQKKVPPKPQKVLPKKNNLQSKSKTSGSPARKNALSARGGGGMPMPDLAVSREWVRSTGQSVTVDDTDMAYPVPVQEYKARVSKSNCKSSRKSNPLSPRQTTLSSVLSPVTREVLNCSNKSSRASNPLSPRQTTLSGVLSPASGLEISVRGGAMFAPPPPAPISASVTSKISNAWYSILKPFRFFVSGNLGNVCFFYCEKAVSAGLDSVASDLPELVRTYKDSVSFFLGYFSHLIFQHFLHAWLVYGFSTIDTPQKYFTTLFGTYGTYVTSAVLSTALNRVLLDFGMDKTYAFVSALYIFAIINYVVIGWIVKESSKEVVVNKNNSNNNTQKGVQPKKNTNLPKKAVPVQPKKVVRVQPKKAVPVQPKKKPVPPKKKPVPPKKKSVPPLRSW